MVGNYQYAFGAPSATSTHILVKESDLSAEFSAHQIDELIALCLGTIIAQFEELANQLMNHLH